MDGFLVVARFYGFDVPLGLFPGAKEAGDYAASVTGKEVRRLAYRVYGAAVRPSLEAWLLLVLEFRGGAPQPRPAVLLSSPAIGGAS